MIAEQWNAGGGSPASNTMIGREAEVATIDAWLREPSDTVPVMLIEGDAGIGKSVLWTCSIGRARDHGYRVLAASPSEVESGLSFSSLGDLIAEVEERTTDALPPPQRRAIMAALLQADAGGDIELRGVGQGLLSMLRTMSRMEPVLLAVDGGQWMDEASAQALTFAVRRLDREPALLLATLRRGSSAFNRLASSLGDRRQVLGLPPLSAEAISGLLSARLDGQFPWPLTAEVHRLAGGNPALALEVAQALAGVERDPGQPRRLPTDLRLRARARIAGLMPAARTVLLILAATARPTVDLLKKVLGDEASSALAQAGDAGLLHVAGSEVRPLDFLVLSAVYWDADDDARRQTHLRLAAATSDPLERLRHLGLSRCDPDAQLASQLERSASQAEERGHTAVALDLAALALGLTPERKDDDRARRRLLTAELRAATGDAGAVTDLLEAARSPSVPDAQRSRLLRLVARSRLLDSGTRAAADVDDGLGLTRLLAGDVTSFEALRSTRADLEAADSWPGRAARHAQFALWGDDLLGSREQLREIEREARRAGNATVLPLLLARLAEVECWLGRWLEACILAHRGRRLARATGQRALRTYHRYVAALAEVHRGDADVARHDALRGEELAVSAGFRPLAALNRSVLGHLELALGNSAAALVHFQPLAGEGWGLGAEPGLARFLPDAIEALVAQREIAEAARLIGDLEALGRQVGAGWPLAAAARCRASLDSAEGRHAEAQKWCWRAIEEDRRLDRGLELGRDLLVQGMVLRRHGNRSGARAALEHAESVFTHLGSAPWRERAGIELSRAGGPRAGADHLDPRERQVAELVAQGRSVPEVARRLGLDASDVEGHLRSAYRKLGVRSRSRLAHRMALPLP